MVPVSPLAASDSTAELDTVRIGNNADNGVFRLEGETVKAEKRGWAWGAVLGLAVGGLIGVAAAALPIFAAATTITTAFVIAGFAGAGALAGAEGLGSVVQDAVVRATGLAVKHAREDDPKYRGNELASLDDKLMVDGHNHHYEFPTNRDKGKFYSVKSGLAGALMAGSIGAITGSVAGVLEGSGIFTAMGAIGTAAGLTALAAPIAGAIAGAVAFGALGSMLGIKRSLFKTVLNHMDAIIHGKIGFQPGPDLGRQQSQETEAELAAHRLQRQAEINRLKEKYTQIIIPKALAARFSGFAGGVPTGILMGAAAGALALGVAAIPALLGVAGAGITGALALNLVGGFASIGGVIGMTTYSDAATKAGAESTARSIEDEHRRNQLLRAQGISPPVPKPENKLNLFDFKAAIVAGIAGAILGACMFSGVGAGVAALFAIKGATLAHLAGAAALTGAGVGVSYGLGSSVVDFTRKGISDPIYRLYDPKHESTPALVCIPAVQQAASSGYGCEKITAEENARLNERLEAGSGKTFAQVAQQLQTPAAVGVGA